MKIILSFLLLIATLPAHAAWTSHIEVSSLKVMNNGAVAITLNNFSNLDESINCEKNVFVLMPEEKGFEARYSAILSAHMAKRRMKFSYYGCSGSYINISSVILSAE